ncbi:MAG: hypothetical protein ACOYXS_05875 [Chloroflexota bacterium]
MSGTLVVQERPETSLEATGATAAAEAAAPVEENLVLGRPVEDRSFEAVEASLGAMTGIAVGAAVAGPVGAAVGGIVGIAAGVVAGEAVERKVGRAAETTCAADEEPPEPAPGSRT